MSVYIYRTSGSYGCFFVPNNQFLLTYVICQHSNRKVNYYNYNGLSYKLGLIVSRLNVKESWSIYNELKIQT